MRLEGRHAIVTGGGTGIGAAIASALACEGATLSLIGRRLEKLKETAASLSNSPAQAKGPKGTADGPWPSPGSISCFTADVADRAQVDAAFEAARAANGPIAILVNNAGAAAGAPFAKVTPELWRNMLAVNLDGVFHCCQAAIGDLLAAPAGRIVTIASLAGLHGFAYASPYIVAKHGAVGLTRALAAEYAGRNLRVNAICPGFVDSDMTVESVANISAKTGRSAQDARAELARLNPSGRLIAPQEVAQTAIELILSDRNGEAVEIG
jgi:NAD(P)-dependent dehydrogenase (short-subunit alcohol dehydrogenase family)